MTRERNVGHSASGVSSGYIGRHGQEQLDARGNQSRAAGNPNRRARLVVRLLCRARNAEECFNEATRPSHSPRGCGLVSSGSRDHMMLAVTGVLAEFLRQGRLEGVLGIGQPREVSVSLGSHSGMRFVSLGWSKESSTLARGRAQCAGFAIWGSRSAVFFFRCWLKGKRVSGI